MSAPARIIDDREAWLERRRSCITATDVAAIVGLHPYVSAHDVYLDKRGLKAEMRESEPMRWGILLEPVIAAEFERRTGKKTEKADFLVDPTNDAFGCTPDYFVGQTELLECKIAGLHAGANFGETGTDEIPPHYLCQCQWQLGVTGRSVCHLAVLINGQDLRLYTVPRDDELIRRLRYHAAKFMGEYVKAENPPPLSGHLPDTEYVKGKFTQDDGSLVQGDDQCDEWAAGLGNKLEDLAKLELEVEALRNNLKNYMGEALTLRTTSGPFTWKKSADRKSVDKDAVIVELTQRLDLSQEAIDELLAAHTTTKEGVRVFRTPFKTGKA